MINVNDVFDAMKREEIKVFFQPQYDAVTYHLRGAEALARWIKEDGSIIMPNDFIPILEQSIAICELDWYILERVCEFLKKQMDNDVHLVPISVNFSRMHVNEVDFVEKLCAIVDKYTVKHKYIQVEITETAYVEEPQKVLNWINKVREKEFAIAIDDFGSGLSSLNFVIDVNADVLKIDKSLLAKNCEDEKERIVLESIFEFAHRLGLTTIAEGVESKEQLGFLRTCDCKLIQGFLFARPMPQEAFWEVCVKGMSDEESEDILVVQAPSSANNLLMQAIFKRYPLIIFANLTRNSYYMMVYDNFSSKSCPSTGVFDELIEHGTTTMHEEDKILFHDTFQRENLLAAYKEGKESIRVVTRQIGDDGVYRRVETTDYFVKNPSVQDVLVITLCHNLED